VVAKREDGAREARRRDLLYAAQWVCHGCGGVVRILRRTETPNIRIRNMRAAGIPTPKVIGRMDMSGHFGTLDHGYRATRLASAGPAQLYPCLHYAE
jgi:hypothetical protein